MALREYHRKRDFGRTREPRGTQLGKTPRGAKNSFVVQKHAATRLHYDFRLEHDGVLLSWAVPKGPSLDPGDKRLAVHVEDHPVEYGSFEGVIPKGQYGGGSVLLWDRGHWAPVGDAAEALRKGKLDFDLFGEKLSGGWTLVRLRDDERGESKNWLLIKRRDEAARTSAAPAITSERPESVASGKVIEEIGTSARARVWNSKRSKSAARKNAGLRPSAALAPRAHRRGGKEAPTRASRAQEGARPRGARVMRLRGAVRGPLPDFVPVQLATLVATAPTGPGWVHEIKFDGYRMLARLDRGSVRWLSRNGLDWSARFQALSPALAALSARRALLDGEMVVLGADGISNFQGLQRALGESVPGALTYFAFDLLHLDGDDLRACTLLDRKRRLEALLGATPPNGPLRYSEHVVGDGPAFFGAACTNRLEGIVSKRAEGRYLSARTRDWTKTKCRQVQEFVVVGFTQPQGSRQGLGALVLAVNEKGRLRLAGRVGTGFDEAMLARLRRRLEPLRVETSPLGSVPAAAARGVSWVEPNLVVEVDFTGWTGDGLLRHPSFEGLREDKDPGDVVRESPLGALGERAPAAATRAAPPSRAETARPQSAKRVRAPAPTRDDGSASVAGVRISHADRIVDAESGTTKLDLAEHYERVAPLLLPHIADRPLSVLRCPDGFARACFFQKHGGDTFPDSVKAIPLRDSSGDALYLSVDSLAGLLGLVQMNVVELHPWGSRADRLDRPDRMFFDLDPAPDVPWKRVVEGALLLRRVLEDMGMTPHVKTTGGKGLHVVVHLAREQEWDQVKAFSRAIAVELVRAQPERYVAVAAKAARRGRIFVDYLRNTRGATAVAPYSVRARAGAPLSMPVSWKDLESLPGPSVYRLQHGASPKKSAKRDPWSSFLTSRDSLPG